MTAHSDLQPADRFRAAGLGIATSLASSAVWSGDLCAFHGATSPESLHHPPRFRSTGGDVYEGTAGIARFLSLAASLSADATLRATACAAMRHAIATIEGWPLFTGGVGVGLVALELAQSLDEPSLVAPAIDLVERASAAAAADGTPYDLLVGIAGVIVGLTAAAEYDRDGAWQRRAEALGHVLLDAAVPDGAAGPDGPPLSWPLARGVPDRLCGLAHGASGVALAFDALAAAASERARDADAWRASARRARLWERAHYSAEAGSWADLRRPETGVETAPPVHPHMWCHGSIGIGAERLAVVDRDLMARSDAVGALAGVRRHTTALVAGPAGPGGGDALNGSQCHGLGGVIDLCVDVWLVTRDTSWIALAGQAADFVINDARREGGWRSGVPGGWSAPGLMLGDAGIGWALLRIAAPDRVPSAWRLGPAPVARLAG